MSLTQLKGGKPALCLAANLPSSRAAAAAWCHRAARQVRPPCFSMACIVARLPVAAHYLVVQTGADVRTKWTGCQIKHF